jgi:hypothetical protein
MPEQKLLMTQVYAEKYPNSYPLKGTQLLSLTSASAQSAALRGDIVLVSATVPTNIAWGSDPTATVLTTGVATDSKALLVANLWEEIHITDGDKIAGITAPGATGQMNIRYGKVQELG